MVWGKRRRVLAKADKERSWPLLDVNLRSNSSPPRGYPVKSNVYNKSRFRITNFALRHVHNRPSNVASENCDAESGFTCRISRASIVTFRSLLHTIWIPFAFDVLDLTKVRWQITSLDKFANASSTVTFAHFCANEIWVANSAVSHWNGRDCGTEMMQRDFPQTFGLARKGTKCIAKWIFTAANLTPQRNQNFSSFSKRSRRTSN